jgi:hypothetical protein
MGCGILRVVQPSTAPLSSRLIQRNTFPNNPNNPGLECLETYPLVWQLPVESISCAGLVTTQDNLQVTALDNGLPV